jgi:hypothetical protein
MKSEKHPHRSGGSWPQRPKGLHLKDDEMPFRLPADKASLNGDFIRVLLILNEVPSQ